MTRPADEEVTPLCPHFGPCGGCQLQHIAYPAQLAAKEATLRDLLDRAGVSAPVSIATHAAAPWHYRNRIRLRVEAAAPADGSPGFLLGYNRRASNELLPITTCPIAAPVLLHTAQQLVVLATVDPNIARWLAAAAELELFCTPAEAQLQLTLWLERPPAIPPSQQARSFAQLAEALHATVPELAGAAGELLRPTRANAARPRAGRRAALGFHAPTSGSPGLLYPVRYPGGQTTAQAPGIAEGVWVSRDSFFQVNRFLLETLVTLAAETLPHAVEPGAIAWDLFAGGGLFTRALARRFGTVAAVESAPGATADLRAAKLPGVRVITSPVLEFLRSAALDRSRPALVLLDPPRAGLGVEAAGLLTRIAPARIVYISCDPATLARDLAAMLFSGYNLAELHLVDMFPQTAHLETVAVLDRSG